MSGVILIDSLSPECSPIMVKGVSSIKGLFCGTVYLLVLLRLQHCCHLEIIILVPDTSVLLCHTLFLFCICAFA